MFDIGFMELLLISIVSLIVIGPERLPGAIRTATLWIGRAKRSFNNVKADIEREMNTDEIRRQLHNETILSDLDKAKKQADKIARDAKKNLDNINAEVNATLLDEEKIHQTPGSTPAKPEAQTQAPAPATPGSGASHSSDQVFANTAPRHEAADTAAKTLDNEKTLDNQEPSDKEVTPESKDLPNNKEPEKSAPVEDFYNNPPSGTIQLRGGVFRPTSSLDDETDSGRR
jgi:sec-independent protein translocase protein TatB